MHTIKAQEQLNGLQKFTIIHGIIFEIQLTKESGTGISTEEEKFYYN